MRKTALFSITTLLAGLLFTAAVGAAGTPEAVIITEVPAVSMYSADHFLGTEVRDVTGTEIGTIRDLIFDMRQGRVTYAIIAANQPQGTEYVVPMRNLTAPVGADYLVVGFDRNQLALSPLPTADQPAEEYQRQIQEYFGQTDPWSNLPGEAGKVQGPNPGSNLTPSVQPEMKQGPNPGANLSPTTTYGK